MRNVIHVNVRRVIWNRNTKGMPLMIMWVEFSLCAQNVIEEKTWVFAEKIPNTSGLPIKL